MKIVLKLILLSIGLLACSKDNLPNNKLNEISNKTIVVNINAKDIKLYKLSSNKYIQIQNDTNSRTSYIYLIKKENQKVEILDQIENHHGKFIKLQLDKFNSNEFFLLTKYIPNTGGSNYTLRDYYHIYKISNNAIKKIFVFPKHSILFTGYVINEVINEVFLNKSNLKIVKNIKAYTDWEKSKVLFNTNSKTEYYYSNKYNTFIEGEAKAYNDIYLKDKIWAKKGDIFAYRIEFFLVSDIMFGIKLIKENGEKELFEGNDPLCYLKFF